MIPIRFFSLCLALILLTLADLTCQVTSDIIYVDNFDETKELAWHSKKKNPENIYKIKVDDENTFLSASSIHDDNFLIKKVSVDLVEYPYLNWKWRALSLPINGDESVKSVCDVAASLNVVLKASKWRPRTIKYSWSTTLPIGTRTKSPFAFWPSRCDIVVIKSGGKDLGTWHTEKINVLEDYKKFYDKEEVKSLIIEAFVIMTDSDNTGSLSEADYDDIFFSKQ